MSNGPDDRAARAEEDWEGEGGALARPPAAAATGARPAPDHERPTSGGLAPPHRKDHAMTTGTITSLRPGGFGFVASDALTRPTKLQFRRAAVAADGFDRLQAGQRVRFDREPVPGNPSRFHAVRVSPED